jgi:transposase
MRRWRLRRLTLGSSFAEMRLYSAPKQTLVAVMRKLLHSIYGMLKHGCDFQGETFFGMPQQA